MHVSKTHSNFIFVSKMPLNLCFGIEKSPKPDVWVKSFQNLMFESKIHSHDTWLSKSHSNSMWKISSKLDKCGSKSYSSSINVSKSHSYSIFVSKSHSNLMFRLKFDRWLKVYSKLKRHSHLKNYSNSICGRKYIRTRCSSRQITQTRYLHRKVY